MPLVSRPLPPAARIRALGASAILMALLALGGAHPRVALTREGRPPAFTAHESRATLASDPERTAFEQDLSATGRVAAPRARALADEAVRQARVHGVPPALLLGVLLVENARLDSRAVSSAGARGLMQVSPLWGPVLGARHGYDLSADSTSLGMGAHILGGLLAHAASLADVEHGLLRYNGCRRALAGRAAACAGYPALVRREVETQASALCPTHSFARCVVASLGAARPPARQD